MGNWMVCEYCGAGSDPSKPNKVLPINDAPVNLDNCYCFERSDIARTGIYQLKFLMLEDEPIVWAFINSSPRDKEYERAIGLMKKIHPKNSN